MVDLPPVRTAADVVVALGALAAAAADGIITPEEAQGLAGILDLQRRTLEMVEIEARLAALEAKDDAQ
jgi:hypothetical protein